MVSAGSHLSYYHRCKDLRSVAAASGQSQLNNVCVNISIVKDRISSIASYGLTEELLEEYPGSQEIKSQMQLAIDHAKQLGISQAVRVLKSSCTVCTLPDTYAKDDTFRCTIM